MTVSSIQTTADGLLEYSVHECPKKHLREVAAIFPNLDLQGILVVPTCQRAEVDLVRVGEKVEDEKDRLLKRFVRFAQAVCDILSAQGYWCDYIDPCSGLPMVHRQYSVPYGEVDALSTLLGYKTAAAGCCKILLHPTWGSSVYPASIFAKAPTVALEAAIKEAQK